MPSTVSVIATGAFKNCYRLEMVNFDGTQEQWSGIVIESDNDSLTNAEICEIAKVLSTASARVDFRHNFPASDASDTSFDTDEDAF